MNFVSPPQSMRKINKMQLFPLTTLRNAWMSFIVWYCSGSLLCCCDKMLIKNNLEKKGFVFQVPSSREVRAAAQSRNWSRDHGKMLLTGFPLLPCPAPLHSPDICLRMALPTACWVHSCGLQLRKQLTDMAAGHFGGGNSSPEVSFPQLSSWQPRLATADTMEN